MVKVFICIGYVVFGVRLNTFGTFPVRHKCVYEICSYQRHGDMPYHLRFDPRQAGYQYLSPGLAATMSKNASLTYKSIYLEIFTQRSLSTCSCEISKCRTLC